MIELTFIEINSNFNTDEILPGIYSNKETSEAFYPVGDLEGNLPIDYEDIRMKTRLILTQLNGVFERVTASL